MFLSCRGSYDNYDTNKVYSEDKAEGFVFFKLSTCITSNNHVDQNQSEHRYKNI